MNELNILIHNTTEGLSLLQGTDYIVIGCRRTFEKYKKMYDLSIKPPPFSVKDVEFSACYHKNKENDKAVLWILSKIKEIVNEIS